jgi:flagellar assembly factor FliW
MKISSPVVGEIEVSPERVITFPAGLPGFEACRQFALLHAEGNDAPQLFMLQSLDDADVGFTVTTPDILGLNYEFVLSDAEVDDLQLTDPADVSVLLIVRRDGDNPVHANVMAPLVINAATRRGLQKIIGTVDTSVTLKAVG